MDLASPLDASDRHQADPRDRAAALLVGGAALLAGAGWLFSLLFGPAPIGSRAELLTITGPTGLVRLGFLVAATVLLAGRSAWLGRIVTVAIALPTTLGLVLTGIVLVRDAGAPAPLQLWIDGGGDLLLLAAAAVAVTVWQDHGRPRLDHPTDLGGKLALVGVLVAMVANAFPPVAIGRVSTDELATLLPRGPLAWVGLVATAIVTIAVVVAGGRLREGVARRLVLLVIGLTGASTVVGNALTILVVRADVRPTVWAGLGAAGYLAILAGAFLTARGTDQTSSAIA